MGSQSAAKAKKFRYTRGNPPTSEAAAQEKLDELDLTIASTGARLEHMEVESFSTVEEYEYWRRRSIRALGYARTESTFLREWLTQHHKSAAGCQKKAANTALEQARTRAEQLAAEIGASYAPVYSTQVSPGNIQTANLRSAELAGMKQRLQMAFSEITSDLAPCRAPNLCKTASAATALSRRGGASGAQKLRARQRAGGRRVESDLYSSVEAGGGGRIYPPSG